MGKKVWSVETETGGFAEPLSYLDAIQLAREMSQQGTCLAFVRHEHASTPDVIFCSGQSYWKPKLLQSVVWCVDCDNLAADCACEDE